MTVIASDAPPTRPARPPQVTVAFWLQVTAGLLLLGMVAALVAHAFYYDGRISRAVAIVPHADPAEVSGERTFNVVMALVVGIPLLALAAWLIATAVPMRRGSNTGRILVFIAAGAHLLLCALPCFGGVMAIPFFVMVPFEEPLPADDLPPDDVMWEESQFMETLYAASTPGDDLLFGGLSLGGGLELLLMVAVVVLLAIPPARRFFVPEAQRPATAMSAATPWPVPALPLYPGQAYPGQAYPGQAYPGYPPLPYVICPDPSVHIGQAAPPAPETPPAG